MVSLSSFREQPIASVLSGLIPARIWEFKPTLLFCASALTLTSSVVLGGGTRGGFLSDAILELIAVPALLISLSSLIDLPAWQANTRTDVIWALAFCLGLSLLPLFQLIPLPPSIWTRLPGRDEIAKVFDLVGDGTPWMPISVSPHATWLSFLSLLPSMAIFIGTLQLGYRERRRLVLTFIAVGVVSAFLGLLQVAQGPGSALRFFSFTNTTEAVGFFANRNHFAALLYVVLIFSAAWAIDVAFKYGSWKELRRGAAGPIIVLTSSFLLLIIVITAETMTRSRAGLTLTIVAMAAVFALVFTDRRGAGGLASSKLVFAAILLAIVLTVQFALYRILDRFVTDPLADARVVFAHNTLRAAWAFMPFGSGLGTFVPVYAMLERPSDLVAGVYANHAHNDILELWLETGIVGLIFMALFIIWFGFTTYRVWSRLASSASAFDSSLIRAATVAVGLLMAHSFVDYPLRTEAMMATVAFCCALMIEPFGNPIAPQRNVAQGRSLKNDPPKPALLSAPTVPAPRADPRSRSAVVGFANEPPKARQHGRWGEDIEWPDEWSGAEPNSPKTAAGDRDKEPK